MDNKYVAWKTLSDLEPISGTDRILLGKSKREIINFLAYEEKVPHNHNDMFVKCNDGTKWFVVEMF